VYYPCIEPHLYSAPQDIVVGVASGRRSSPDSGAARNASYAASWK
jgi:hypothetical protein